jgi:hypothetical protein
MGWWEGWTLSPDLVMIRVDDPFLVQTCLEGDGYQSALDVHQTTIRLVLPDYYLLR